MKEVNQKLSCFIMGYHGFQGFFSQKQAHLIFWPFQALTWGMTDEKKTIFHPCLEAKKEASG